MNTIRRSLGGFGAVASLPLRNVRMAGSSRPRLSGTGQPPPPGINCQATQDGGAICSEGTGFSPTCPKKPNPNVPGVAQYRQEGNVLIPIPPPPPGATPAAAPAGATPTVPVAPSPAVQQNFAAGACPLANAMAQMPSGGVPAAPAVPYGAAPGTPPLATTPVPATVAPAAPAAPIAPVAAPPPPPVPLVFSAVTTPSDQANPATGLLALGAAGLLIYWLIK